MNYRTLGKSGLLVSQLGFGTMRLPISKKNPDFAEAISLIQYGIEKGINFFDVGTFYCHGYCEEVFGNATKDIPRERLIISGKNSAHQSNSEHWLGQLKNSLRLFHREFFDLYFLHYLNYEQWTRYFIGNKVIDQIEEARKSGLIRHLAFSSHDSPDNVMRI
ncbi:MAG: aldo/keto reductase, partial [Ignavibacteriales bacterium]|nr:aldo/keto reductase [Ignavibacteriales bacterium]